MDKKRTQIKYYMAAFFLAVIAGALFVVPFTVRGGGIYYLGSDFVEQQIPFWTYCNNAIKQGNIWWSAANDLGTQFIGAYSFYNLTSPFFLLSLLIDADKIYLFIGRFLLLKFGVCSTAAFAYIKQYTKTPFAAVIAGLIYTFCGWQISNMNFFHFIDAAAMFPFMLLALDMAFKKDKKGFFALTVAICAFTNYVLFVGEVVFLVLYLAVKLWCGEYRLTVKKFLQMAFESVAGVGISFVVLWPSVLFLLGNPRLSRGYESVWQMFVLKPIYWAEIIRGSLFPAECIFDRGFYLHGFTNGAELYLPLFGMVAVFAYIWKNKSSWISRLLVVCAVFAVVPVLNSAFVRFNSEYYTRWYYMPVLICAVATALFIEDRSISIRPGALFYFGLWLALGVVFVIFTYYFKVTFIYNMVPVAMYVIVSLSGFAVTLLWRKLQLSRYRNVLLAAAVVLYCSFGGIINSYYHQRGRDAQAVKSYYQARQNIDTERFEDSYRISSGYFFMNMGTILGQSTTTTFSSNISGSAFDFYAAMEIPRSVITSIDKDEYFLMTFLSSKYYIEYTEISRTDSDMFVSAENEGGFRIQQYRYTLPMGYAFDSAVPQSEYDKLDARQKRQYILKALIVEDTDMVRDVLDIKTARQITARRPDIRRDTAALAEKACTDFDYTNRGFSAKYTGSQQDVVFFSVPYDKGWNATVNGQPAQIIKAGYGFMAVKVAQGENYIEFTYQPEGFKTGAVVSVLSTAAVAVYTFSGRKRQN